MLLESDDDVVDFVSVDELDDDDSDFDSDELDDEEDDDDAAGRLSVL